MHFKQEKKDSWFMYKVWKMLQYFGFFTLKGQMEQKIDYSVLVNDIKI